MRFLILTQYFPPEVGAAQTRLAAVAQELSKAGHEVEVVTCMPNYPTGVIAPEYRNRFYIKDKWNGIDVHHFWCYPSQGKTIKRLLNYLSFAFTAFFGVFKCQKPDVVFVNSGPLFLSIPGWFYSKLWSADMVFNVSDLWPRSVEHIQGLGGKVFLKLAGWLELWSYRQADYVTAVTEGIRECLLQEKGVPLEKILFLPNGVDTSMFEPTGSQTMKQKLGLEDKFLAIYPGNHGYAHALEKVLMAAEILQSKDPSLHFVFVGGGSEKDKLQEYSRTVGLRNVTFCDPVPPKELVSYIDSADLGLIHMRNSPLANETRPAKMFPLMAMKKPILYAGFGEGAELLKSIDGGVIIEPEQPEALANAFMSMKLESARRLQMGERNREFVISKLSFSKIVSDWVQSLEERRQERH